MCQGELPRAGSVLSRGVALGPVQQAGREELLRAPPGPGLGFRAAPRGSPPGSLLRGFRVGPAPHPSTVPDSRVSRPAGTRACLGSQIHRVPLGSPAFANNCSPMGRNKAAAPFPRPPSREESHKNSLLSHLLSSDWMLLLIGDNILVLFSQKLNQESATATN